MKSIFHKSILKLASMLSSNIKWHTIQVEGYNVCNLKCKMCPYELMSRKKEKMSFEFYKRVIDLAENFGIRNVELNFYNEPLLDDLLIERILYAKAKGMNVALSTNGVLLTDEKISMLLEAQPDVITISFDGATKETYEKIRRGGNFEKVKENIIKLVNERNRRKSKTKITITYTVVEDNFNEIDLFEKSWINIVDEINFWEADERRGKPLIATTYSYPCYRLLYEGRLIVLSNGKVALCCKDYDGKYSIGDLNNQSIEDIWNSKKFRWIKNLHYKGEGYKIELCKNCEYLYDYKKWLLALLRRIHIEKIVAPIGVVLYKKLLQRGWKWLK